MAGTPQEAGRQGPELRDTIPITAHGKPKVVMSLRGENLPSLRAKDQVEVRAELEVTVKPGYSYSPRVQARLLLTDDIATTDPSAAQTRQIGPTKKLRCSQREHHCVLVWDRAEAVLGRVSCTTCHLNLVVGASSTRADSNDDLMIGENNDSRHRTVDQNHGRLNVVRVRPGKAKVGTPKQVPVVDGPPVPVRRDTRTVVRSWRLRALSEGDQLRVELRLDSGTGGNYPTRTSTQVILPNSANSTEPVDHASHKPGGGKDANGTITAFNGFNCLPSAVRCTTHKAGVIRNNKHRTGDLWVNVLMTAADPMGGAGGNDTIKPRDIKLTIRRYPDSPGGA